MSNKFLKKTESSFRQHRNVQLADLPIV